jgi:hypothetical protein
MAQFSSINTKNQPNPGDLDPWLEVELDRISREYNVPLRWAWAPDRERREMVGLNGATAGYPGKVYAIPNLWEAHHLGWFRCDPLKQTRANPRGVIAYHGPGELPTKFPPNGFIQHRDEKTGQWWVPDIQKVQVAYSRWLIETHGPDEREQWEEVSWNSSTLELVQELGPWTSESIWVSCGDFIAEHHPAKLCCMEANQARTLCPGNYRAPDRRDTEAVERAIQLRNEKGLWVGPNVTNDAAAAQALKDLVEQEEIARQQMIEGYRQALHEAINPLIQQCIPKSGPADAPRFRTPITEKELLEIANSL